MYAVIETGGKQYRVEVGTELEVELLDVEPGNTVTIDRVLLVADGDDASIGRPLVDGAAVSAEVLRRDRGPKLISFKYRPKARSRVKKGHRQELTVLRVSDIVLGDRSAAKDAAKAEQDAKTERMRLEEVASAQAAKDAELAAKLAREARKSDAKSATDADAAAKTPANGPDKPAAKGSATTTSKADSTKKPATKKSAAKARAKDSGSAAAKAGASTTPTTKKPATKPRATKKDE